MRNLWPYVDDDKIIDEIKAIINNGKTVSAKVDINRNVADPFQAIVNMAILEFHFDEWEKMEKVRQSQKSIQNTIGYFHQHILGMVDGWQDPGLNGVVDSKNDSLKIVAEIKNKWNTMNDNSSKETYDKLVEFLEHNPGYTAYVVKIIPKSTTRYKKQFAPGGRKRRDDIIEVDGATYYELVTGDKYALKKLFKALPDAIEAAVGNTSLMDSYDETKLAELFSFAFGK